MAKPVLTISSKNYGAWALRGWLMAVPSQELVRQRLGCAPAAAPAVAPIASAPVQANAQGPTSSAAGASTP